MGRRSRRRELVVAMNGELVGHLRSSGAELSFGYAPSWWQREHAIPLSLSLPLSSEPYRGSVVSSYFDNLLPDVPAVRESIAEELGLKSARPFDLLAALGRDCVGAIQLLPPTVPLHATRTIESVPLSDAEIAGRLRALGSRPLGIRSEEEDSRISVAGAQRKTALLRYRGQWHLPKGPTPTSHLFKPPIGELSFSGGLVDFGDSVENEWLCSRLVAAFDLPVAGTQVAAFEEQKVLVVERFDRRWSRDGSWLIRLPQEDTCQALGVPPTQKYESDGGPGIEAIMQLLLESSIEPMEDRRRFMKAQVLYWMLAATDGHGKNFSLALYPGGRVRLAPLYDVLSSYPILERRRGTSRKIRMAMAVRGKSRHSKWAEIQRRHWLSTAARCRFPTSQMEALLEDLAATVEPAIEAVSAELPDGFPESVAGPIFEGLRGMKERLIKRSL